MENPFFWQTYGISALMAFIAGIIPSSRRSKIFRVILLCIAVLIFSYFIRQYVDWAYDHPVNPSDGAAKTLSVLFGWLIGLVWPIVPSFFLARGLVWCFRKFQKKPPSNL
jgi:hypothetical protein